MIDVDTLDIETDRARYMLALAESLGEEGTTLGPTDTALIKEALRLGAEAIDAGLA